METQLIEHVSKDADVCSAVNGLNDGATKEARNVPGVVAVHAILRTCSLPTEHHGSVL